MNTPVFTPFVHDTSRLLGMALAFAAATVASQLVGDAHFVFSLCSGLAVAALAAYGMRYGVGVAMGAVLAALWLHGATVLFASMALTAGTAAASALAGAWVLRRRPGLQADTLSRGDIGSIGLVAASAGAVDAGLTALAWQLGVVDVPFNPLFSGLAIFLRNALGVLLLLPVLHLWWHRQFLQTVRSSVENPREAVAIAIVFSAGLVGSLVFHDWQDVLSHHYWRLAFVVWSAVRLGTRGSSVIVLLICLLTDTSSTPATDELQLLGYAAYTFVLWLAGLWLGSYADSSRAQHVRLQQSERTMAHELKNNLAAWDEHAIMSTTDTRGRILSVNEKFCDISGYSAEELLGKDHRIVNSGMHSADFFADMYRTIGRGNVWHGAICNRAKSGQLYWVQSTIAPFFDDHGKPVSYIAIRTDITQRKRTEMELLLHREQLEIQVAQRTDQYHQSLLQTKQALSELHYQKYMLDQHALVTITDSTGRITYCNDKFCAVSGYARDEIIGQDHKLLKSGYHPKEFFGAMYHTVQRGDVWHGEICNLTKDGKLFWVDSTIAAQLDADGQPREYTAIRTNITERKRAEDLAQAANLAKSQFLANMSHEIRTPINGVIGMTEVLQQSALQPTQKRLLDTIHSSSLTLLAILNDVLDFSKIEAGKLEIELIPTHVRDIAEGVCQLTLAMNSARHNRLSLFVDPQLPIWISCDPMRLRQILLNLMGNALKFIDREFGRIRLHVLPTTLPGGEPGILFSVKDNGIGMSEAVVNQLFQPFTQADASTARKFGGTGLGLSISKRLVDLLQGHIHVVSAPKKGSEFVVVLPLQASPPPGGRSVERTPDLQGVHVIVVSNAQDTAFVMPAYLGATGAQVEVMSTMALRASAPRTLAPNTVIVQDMNMDLGWEDDIAIGIPGGQRFALPNWATSVPVVRMVPRGMDVNNPGDFPVPTRPMMRGDMLRAVAMASGRWTESENATDPLPIGDLALPAQELAAEVRNHQLILLAEDNETNRDVVREQLRLLGYACEVANDGVEALEMWRTQRFAILLTDCHMPNMDGFELTQAIRAEEQADTHLPIIAVTANALQGEAERCRERGMDDYLSKPLRMRELASALARWLSPHSATTPAKPPDEPLSPKDADPQPGQTRQLAIWNPQTLFDLVGDNPEVHQRLMSRFLVNAREQVQAVNSAITNGNLATVRDQAHTLKSAARSVGALRLGELCQQLEHAAHASDAPQCGRLAGGLGMVLNHAEELIKTRLS